MAEGRLVCNLKNDYLTCSICVETYTDPKKLECGHSFCSLCLEEYLRTNYDHQADTMVCPMCRQASRLDLYEDPKLAIDALPSDVVLLSVLKAVRPHMKAPDVTDISRLSFSDSSIKDLKCVCEFHPDKTLEVYCAKHDIVICPECAWREHKDPGCKCLSIQEVTRKRFGALKCLVAQQVADAAILFESSDPNTETLQNLHDSCHKSIAEVEERFAQLSNSFYERIKRLKENTTEGLEKDASAKAVKDLQQDLIEKIKFFENDDDIEDPNRTLAHISELFATSSRLQTHIQNLSDKVKTGSVFWGIECDLNKLEKFVKKCQENLPEPFLAYSEIQNEIKEDSEYVMVTNSGKFADTKERVEDSIDNFQQFSFSAKQNGEQNCNLSSIALLGTTSLVVIDQMNRNIKKFKVPEGRFLCEILLEHEPHQVATVPESSHILVTVWDVPRILILASDPVLKLLQVIDTDMEYIGVASNITGSMVVSNIRNSRVDIIDINHSTYQIVGRETVSQSSRIRSFPDRLAVTRNQSIIIRNKRRNEVKCVGKDKKVLWSRRFKSPVADVACFRGKVFASLVKKNEIFCFQENGIDDVKSFKPKTDINGPWSMDGFKDCLVVTEDSPSDLIHVFVFSCGN